MTFAPNLDMLPSAQLALWPELSGTPARFTLYGGTAIALRLGHRASVHFDFFSRVSFDPERLADEIPCLRDEESIQIAPDTLTCRVSRGGPVLLSFFWRTGFRSGSRVRPHQRYGFGRGFPARCAGTKAAVVQERAEVKDYLDIHAILRHGVGLPVIMAAGSVVYGRNFNSLITLKALSFFDDVPTLPKDVRAKLIHAVETIDVTVLPELIPFIKGSGDKGIAL